MKPIILFAASILISTTAHAQTAKPYKLIITWHQNEIVVIDYPTKERCEAAAKDIFERMGKKMMEAGMPREAGDIGFCITG